MGKQSLNVHAGKRLGVGSSIARNWHVLSAHCMRTVCLVNVIYHDISTISNSCDDPGRKLNFRHNLASFRSLLHVHTEAK